MNKGNRDDKSSDDELDKANKDKKSNNRDKKDKTDKTDKITGGFKSTMNNLLNTHSTIYLQHPESPNKCMMILRDCIDVSNSKPSFNRKCYY